MMGGKDSATTGAAMGSLRLTTRLAPSLEDGAAAILLDEAQVVAIGEGAPGTEGSRGESSRRRIAVARTRADSL